MALEWNFDRSRVRMDGEREGVEAEGMQMLRKTRKN